MTATTSRSADPRTDEQLALAHAAGDGAAFDELVRRYQRRVYGIAYRYFGDPADAEDAAQDAFLALLRRGSTYNGQSAFSTWMYRVTTNACNDIARKRARRPQSAGVEITDLPAEATRDTMAEDALASRELDAELTAALATLEPEHREAVVLHDVYGLGYAEIAERTGVAVGTIKSRIHRAHGRLAAALVHLREPTGPTRPPTERP
jgi:RNA polymerase sigma-70 factor, ECF subfamily